MNYTISEVLQFVEENDVKFIRLAFCDIFGVQKNISIMPSELPRAFNTGISFDASSIDGFMNIDESDLFLVPDPSTLSILPWRPSRGRVVRFFCDIKYPDGRHFEGDGRYILKNVLNELKEMKYICKVGTEFEFYLFETDENGFPTKKPFDMGTYFDIAPIDKGENIRREICLTLEEMNITPESSHHESGPGQNEIDFKYDDALTTADNFVTFKSVVKSVAARNGLYASFMPKPLKNESGNGLHINLSLFKNGLNIFKTEIDEHSQAAESFIAGILERIQEITLFLNPITNSYSRFGNFEAPKYISWSHQNRSQLIRIPASKGENSRMELRSPDPSCNPYIALALIIKAGMEGIKKGIKLIPSYNFNMYENKNSKDFKKLPENLEEAIILAEKSDFIKSVIPNKTLEKYISIKRKEYSLYSNSEDKENFELFNYFYRV